jgi:hypothetical protein
VELYINSLKMSSWRGARSEKKSKETTLLLLAIRFASDEICNISWGTVRKLNPRHFLLSEYTVMRWPLLLVCLTDECALNIFSSYNCMLHISCNP